jgi:hypothetical protein
LPVDDEFVYIITYGLAGAVCKVLGKEKADSIFRLAGEREFGELKKKVDISETEPVAVLNKIARWFEKTGYLQRQEIKRTSENEIIVDTYGVSEGYYAAGLELKKENASTPHYWRCLAVAALKDRCALKAKAEPLSTRAMWEERPRHYRDRLLLSKT